MNNKNLILLASMSIAILVSQETSGSAWAQDAVPGAATAPPSTVIKNRSPVELKPLEVKLPPAKEDTLPNGSHIFVIEDHRAPLITITVSVRAGSLFEDNDKRGVSDLVASTLIEGTKSYSADQLAALTDKYGARFGANAGDERTTVSLSCLSENAAELIPVLAELVYQPVFPAERVQRVRFRAQAGATARQSDPNSLAGDALRAALYGADSPYGRPSVKPEEIVGLTAADLQVFHGKLFRPDTAIIGVAGDVKSQDIIALLRKSFGTQSKPTTTLADLPPATLVGASSPAPAPIIIDRPGSAQTVLNFGVPGIKRDDPDYFPLLLANRILGGGFNSRLNQKLREEKGYTYGARSTLSTPKWSGIWTASASVRNAVTADAAKDFVGEFVKLQTVPPKQGELDLIKQSLIGNFALTLESPEAVLARSIERYEYKLPADYWSTYADRVLAVTPADVTRVARKYLGKAGDPTAVSAPKVWAVAVGEKSAIETGVDAALATPSQ